MRRVFESRLPRPLYRLPTEFLICLVAHPVTRAFFLEVLRPLLIVPLFDVLHCRGNVHFGCGA